MSEKITFIYDGECPFCNHFAELLELKTEIKNFDILDGRKNHEVIKNLLKKGYDLDKGAILLKGEEIYHGSNAINQICKMIINPSGNLIKLLSLIFKSRNRTQMIFPFLLRARRLSLIAKGVPTSLT
ncbi:MAG: hypothetical protein CMK49_03380 [Prochlorococcus sp. SP3034]|nr:hypothetical protein [Prochlorococcus sp. SP3034]|tara:strand:- start:7624 stop:8004 length:381 start_codon:yes stop_codon:yes gene_type:complete